LFHWLLCETFETLNTVRKYFLEENCYLTETFLENNYIVSLAVMQNFWNLMKMVLRRKLQSYRNLSKCLYVNKPLETVYMLINIFTKSYSKSSCFLLFYGNNRRYNNNNTLYFMRELHLTEKADKLVALATFLTG
jgi:hypothetical protein